MKYKKIESIEELKKMSCQSDLEVFILLSGGLRSSKCISYDYDSDSWLVFNEIDGAEDTYDSTEEFKKKYPLFPEAIDKGCLYEY